MTSRTPESKLTKAMEAELDRLGLPAPRPVPKPAPDRVLWIPEYPGQTPPF